MQQKHAEVARLTYAKNIQRCLSIHGNIPKGNADEDDDEGSEELDP